MKSIGSVVSILDKNYLLARINKEIPVGKKLKVFEKVKIDNNDTELREIVYPKGKLVVVLKQKEDIYLLTREHAKIVYNNNLALKMSGLVDVFGGTSATITEEIPEGAKPHLDQAESLGVDLDPSVHVGDLITEDYGE